MRVRKKYNKLWLVIVVSALLIFLHYTKILHPLETVIINALKPGLGFGYALSTEVDEIYKNMTGNIDWQARARSLESANAELMMTNSQLQYLKEENETLRQFLNFFEKEDHNYLVARVINRQLVTNDIAEHNKLIINKGSRHGLIVGLLVIEENGLVIGRLVEVNKDWSEVALITNPNCRLAVSIQPNNQVMGVAQGDAGLTVKIGFIPQNATISTDDMVVTSGLEENIPPAMILGRIKQVQRESNELWQEALVEPIASLDNLAIVSIVLPQVID